MYGLGAYLTWNGLGTIFSQNLKNDGLFIFHLILLVALSGVFSGFFGFDSFLGMTLRTKGQIFFMRPTSGLLHELNMFGYLCAFGLFLSSYMYSSSKISWFKYCISLCVFCAGNIVSFNRSSLLAIMFGYFFFKSYKSNRDYLIKAIHILILGVSIYIISNNKYFVTLSGSDIGMANREYIWPHALEKASERPLSGYGFRPGKNRDVMWDYLSGILRGDEPRGAHNTFLDFLLKGGLFVGAFYFSFYVYTSVLIVIYGKLRRNSPWQLFVLRIAFLSLISSMFLSYGVGGLSLVSLIVNLSFYTIFYYYEDKCSSNYNESSRRSYKMFRLT
jgi:O-antigen ligase